MAHLPDFGLASCMEIKRRFGLALRREREKLDMSQEWLANEIGVDQAYVSRMESGQVNLTLETMEALAAALGVDPVALIAKPHAASRRQ